MSRDCEAALIAALDERDRLAHELGQVVRDLSGHDDPEVRRAVERASCALVAIMGPDEAQS